MSIVFNVDENTIKYKQWLTCKDYPIAKAENQLPRKEVSFISIKPANPIPRDAFKQQSSFRAGSH